MSHYRMDITAAVMSSHQPALAAGTHGDYEPVRMLYLHSSTEVTFGHYDWVRCI